VRYIPEKNDDEPTTIRIPKRLRRKIGLLVNKNTTIPEYLEKLIDRQLKRL